MTWTSGPAHQGFAGLDVEWVDPAHVNVVPTRRMRGTVRAVGFNDVGRGRFVFLVERRNGEVWEVAATDATVVNK